MANDIIATRNNVVATINSAKNSFTAVLPADQKKQLDKFMATATNAVMDNPALIEIAKNNPGSLNLALARIAEVGLSPNPIAKQVYLIPRGNEVTVNISYLGFSELIMRTGLVEKIVSDVVYENDAVGEDEMGYSYVIPGGDRSNKKARFEGRATRGEPFASFAYLVYKDGTRSEQFTADRDRIQRAMEASESYKRDRNKGTSYSPWNKHREEMIRKTAIHAMVKWVQLSTEDWRENQAMLKDAAHDLTLTASDQRARELVNTLESEDIIEPEAEIVDEAPTVEAITEPQKNELLARAQKLYESPEALAVDIQKIFGEDKTLETLTTAEADHFLAYLAGPQQ